MGCCGEVRRVWKDGRQYVEAVWRWLGAGRPKRTGREIVRIFDHICKPCKHFEPLKERPWKGRCGKCGCYLGRHTQRFLLGNKIAMGTEHCPERKW